MNDAGKWMYYENGKPVTGKKDIGGKLGCPMSEPGRLNNKSRFSLILPGEVLRVPEK